jgi:hypothetical protein
MSPRIACRRAFQATAEAEGAVPGARGAAGVTAGQPPCSSLRNLWDEHARTVMLWVKHAWTVMLSFEGG